MLRLPKKIRVVSTWYKIKREGLAKDKWGRCDFDSSVIELAKRFPNEPMKARTVHHEITHAILHDYDIGLTPEQEEKVCLAMENGHSALAKDHQDLFLSMVKAMGKK